MRGCHWRHLANDIEASVLDIQKSKNSLSTVNRKNLALVQLILYNFVSCDVVCVVFAKTCKIGSVVYIGKARMKHQLTMWSCGYIGCLVIRASQVRMVARTYFLFSF